MWIKNGDSLLSHQLTRSGSLLLLISLSLSIAGCEREPSIGISNEGTGGGEAITITQVDASHAGQETADGGRDVDGNEGGDGGLESIDEGGQSVGGEQQIAEERLCGEGLVCPRGHRCVCAFDLYCRCDTPFDRGGCDTDEDCRPQERCVDHQRLGLETPDRICWLEPSALTPKVCPGSEGCLSGTGVLLAGARSMVITPDGYETATPLGLDDFHLNFTPPIMTPSPLWRDCGYDDLCPEDEGYMSPDPGEGDGELQGIFIAGFQHGRPAQFCPETLIGCAEVECCVSRYAHDDLKAQVVVFQQGDNTVGLISVDVLGLSLTDIDQIRWAVQREVSIDLLLIGATHSHEGPDTVGQYGPGDAIPLRNGQDPRWMSLLKSQIIAGVKGALEDLAPARVEAGIIDEGISGLAMSDSRPPYIFDDNLPFIYVSNAETGASIASLVSVGNHPETLWSKNPYLSSDYFHYVRYYLREGLSEVRGEDDTLLKPRLDGVGGVILTFAGAIGGLINPGRGVAINYADVAFSEEGFAKADAVGQQVAARLLSAKARGALSEISSPSAADPTPDLSLLRWAQTRFLTPIENPNFLMAGFVLKVIRRGIYNAKHLGGISFTPSAPMVLSETTVIQLGDVTLFTAPGEVFPELLTGGYPHRHSAQSPTIGDVLGTRIDSVCDENGLPPSEGSDEEHTAPCVVTPDQVNPPDWTSTPLGPYLYESIEGRPFFIGLGGDFLGYIVPEYDFIFDGAGNHYEETNSTSVEITQRWRDALQEVLSALHTME